MGARSPDSSEPSLIAEEKLFYNPNQIKKTTSNSVTGMLKQTDLDALGPYKYGLNDAV